MVVVSKGTNIQCAASNLQPPVVASVGSASVNWLRNLAKFLRDWIYVFERTVDLLTVFRACSREASCLRARHAKRCCEGEETD